MKRFAIAAAIVVVAATFISVATAQTRPDRTPENARVIPFGTALDPETQVRESRKLAEAAAAPGTPGWQAKGDQHRTYRSPGKDAPVPYRLYVPSTWDGKSKLPMVVMLHGAGSNENMYVDQNNKQLLQLAEQHGYVLVSPLGDAPMGAYGTCLRLPAVFGQAEAAAQQRATSCVQNEASLERSEKDVINVIELVLREYAIDRESMFLMGHSMGSGGTWYLGAKYSDYWAAIAPMSGPFVEEATYPWERIRRMPIFITEGTGAPQSLEGSRAIQQWMKSKGFKVEYKEVDANHGGMVPLSLPSIFDFFDRNRKK
ncbi:MAG TPA: PHB depolymerase family esterase [Terriglobia bacterium]|nr:PHB depolymerase family esterase [Terriglobia bacterium]